MMAPQDTKKRDVIYWAAFNRNELWNPNTIEKILHDFPKGYIDEGDLFLIVTECVANAVLHGQVEELCLTGRLRHGVLLLSFQQVPKLQNRLATVLSLARSGHIGHDNHASDLPGGLGFPILLRLVHRITLNISYTAMQMWIRTPKP